MSHVLFESILTTVLVWSVALAQAAPSFQLHRSSPPHSQPTIMEGLSSWRAPSVAVTPTLSNPARFPPLPPSIDHYRATLLAFLNDQPSNEAALELLLAYWRTQEQANTDPTNRPRYHHPGRQVARVDLNRDRVAELIVVIDGAVNEPVAGLLFVFARQPDGHYRVTTTDLPPARATPYGTHIATVADFNQTPAPEIVLLSYSSGACTSFTTMTILNWRPSAFRTLLHATLNDAGLTTEDVNHGIHDMLLTGGGASCYAPILRTTTERYTWDGHTYVFVSRTNDPITAQHPYFKLLDGNQLAAKGQFHQAITLYREALATPYPWNDPKHVWAYTDLDPLLLAILRFRLMVSYIRVGELPRAQQIAQDIAAQDGSYAVWSQAFWRAYTQEQRVNAACQAAMTTAYNQPSEPWWLPGYTARDSHYDAAILCS